MDGRQEKMNNTFSSSMKLWECPPLSAITVSMTPVVWLILLSILEIKGFGAVKSISVIQAWARQWEQGKSLAEMAGPSRVWPADEHPTTSPCCSQTSSQQLWALWSTGRRTNADARAKAPAATCPGLTHHLWLPSPVCPTEDAPDTMPSTAIVFLDCWDLPRVGCQGHRGRREGLKQSWCCCLEKLSWNRD